MLWKKVRLCRKHSCARNAALEAVFWLVSTERSHKFQCDRRRTTWFFTCQAQEMQSRAANATLKWERWPTMYASNPIPIEDRSSASPANPPTRSAENRRGARERSSTSSMEETPNTGPLSLAVRARGGAVQVKNAVWSCTSARRPVRRAETAFRPMSADH